MAEEIDDNKQISHHTDTHNDDEYVVFWYSNIVNLAFID
jgi:hypothetical protein